MQNDSTCSGPVDPCDREQDDETAGLEFKKRQTNLSLTFISIMTAIEKGSTNVYGDLESPEPDTMYVKARLAARIREIIKNRHLTQQQAADILGMPQPKLSGMLRGKFQGKFLYILQSC